jgi:F0F1-type ATP synthase epsilon subunit
MSANELTLRILAPDGQVLEAERLKEVVVPLADGGTIGIRPQHAPLIAETVTGTVRIVREGETGEVQLIGGLLSIRDNIVTILTAGDTEEQDSGEDTPSDPYEALAQALENDDSLRGAE